MIFNITVGVAAGVIILFLVAYFLFWYLLLVLTDAMKPADKQRNFIQSVKFIIVAPVQLLVELLILYLISLVKLD